MYCVQVEEHALICNALRQRVRRLKQRKTDKRWRLCFDGLDIQCCIEAVSNLVKTVKDQIATQDTTSMDRQTSLRLRLNLHF